MMIYALSLEKGHHASQGKLSSNAGSKAEQHPFMVVCFYSAAAQVHGDAT